MKLELTKEGAVALREFAAALPRAISLIVQETEQLKNEYDGLEEELGEHSDSFKKMIENIRQAQTDAEEAVMRLPKKMEETAALIEQYVKNNPSVN